MLRFKTEETPILSDFLHESKQLTEWRDPSRCDQPPLWNGVKAEISYEVGGREFVVLLRAETDTTCRIEIAEALGSCEELFWFRKEENGKTTREYIRYFCRSVITSHMDRFPMFRRYREGEGLYRQFFKSELGELVAWDMEADRPKTQTELNRVEWVGLGRRPRVVMGRAEPAMMVRALYGIQFDTLVGMDLTKKTLRAIDLSREDLSRAKLDGSNLKDSRFVLSNLSGTSLRNAYLEDSDFEQAELEGADLSSSNLSYVNFHMARLMGADLRGAELEGARFHRARLDGADLRGCRGTGVDMRTASLRDAKLTGVHLPYFQGSNADFQSVDLRRVVFRQADLSYANFSGASLHGARFDRSDLEGAKFEGARFCPRTVWPLGFDPEEAGAIYDGPYEEDKQGAELCFDNPCGCNLY